MRPTKKNIFVLISVFAFVASAKVMPRRLPRSTDTCGVSKGSAGLIVRGQTFKRGDFPWTVALLYSGTNPPSYFCGGTLISSTSVISAAHCILEKGSNDKLLARDVRALFGAHDLNDSFESERFALSPKKITVHNEWNPHITSYDADISLLEFEQGSIHFNDYVQPICFWDSSDEPPVTDGIVTGWGKSEDPSKIHENKPKLIKAPMQSNDFCLPGQGKLADISSNRTFCAGLQNGSGVCFGDSGGGLFIKVNGVFYLKGIVSSSLIKEDLCDVSRNAVYTNVPKFRDWIEKTTESALVFLTQAVKQVLCTFGMTKSVWYGNLNTCSISQTIDSEEFVLGSPLSSTVERFNIEGNKEVKFLPRHIGEKLPKLKELWVDRCGVSVVRDDNFKNMQSLLILGLSQNEISTVEPGAFADLISVQKVFLFYNAIETLDEKLFAPMVNLQYLRLDHNKIKFLSPATLKIVDGKLGYVNLQGNVCINRIYNSDNWNQLESDLMADCKM